MKKVITKQSNNLVHIDNITMNDNLFIMDGNNHLVGLLIERLDKKIWYAATTYGYVVGSNLNYHSLEEAINDLNQKGCDVYTQPAIFLE